MESNNMEKETSVSSSSLDTAGNTVNDFGSVRSSTERVFWKWTITDYSIWPRKSFEFTSPTFSSASVQWCLELRNTSEPDLFLQFCILSPNKNPRVKGTISISMISVNGKKYEVCQGSDFSVNQATKYPTFHLNKFFEKDVSLKDMFKFEGVVSITTILAESYLSEAAHRTNRTVSDDLGSLLESGDLSDVELCAGDTTFRVHKVVLAARSPVFAAMFRHDTRECQTGTINIPDVEPRVLQQLLCYVYTGKVEIMEGMADRLLMAADKYDLPGLKASCEAELFRCLTVDNAVATAILGLTHDCDFLKQAAIRFIKENIYLILGSDGWYHTATEHPELIRQLSRLVADQTCK